MMRELLCGLAVGLIFTTAARGAEPQQLEPSQMLVTPGDPALSKELAAKLTARAALFTDATAITTGPAVAPPAASPARPPLTPDVLQQMLENLGYAPKVVKSPTGETVFMLTIARGTWTLRPTVALTIDGKQFAIMHYVTQKIDLAKVDAARWQKLLEANVAIAPNVFAVMPQTQQLLLYRAERNVDISPVMLRQWLDSSMDVIIATHDSWKGLQGETAVK